VKRSSSGEGKQNNNMKGNNKHYVMREMIDKEKHMQEIKT
jgi:hypothetical protein